jgi:hypothetical protein
MLPVHLDVGVHPEDCSRGFDSHALCLVTCFRREAVAKFVKFDTTVAWR